MSSQTHEPEHRFAGEQLVPAESELKRFDDLGLDRDGWVRVEVQRKADGFRVRVRDRTEEWNVRIEPNHITVEGPNGEASVPEWVRETVTWNAIDPSLSATYVP